MKENSVNYFNLQYNKGNQFYESQFDTDKEWVGENGNKYCLTEESRKNLHEYNPKMKLIFIIREPIERAFSQWMYNHNRGFQGSFETMAQQNLDKIKKGQHKDEYLNLWLEKKKDFYLIGKLFFQMMIL